MKALSRRDFGRLAIAGAATTALADIPGYARAETRLRYIWWGNPDRDKRTNAAVDLYHKKYPDIHLISGQALTAQNQTARAIDEYETYLEEYPDSPQAAQVRQTMAQLQAKVQ